MSLFFIQQHYSCQDLPAFDWNSEYSQLVTNNSRKSSNHTVVHADS